jgi:hypothetical protein
MKKYQFMEMQGVPVKSIKRDDNFWIPLVNDNTDYKNFKQEINEETAQLKDVDGNTMTAAEAKAFVATLP